MSSALDDPDLRTERRHQADALRRLHHQDTPLVLPNAWDVPSARVFAAHPHCRALGTSSSGISASLGWSEAGGGELVPRAEMLAAIGRIARSVDVPVTADLESGYGRSPDEVATTVRSALDEGAVGVNIEDVARDGDLLAVADATDRLRAAREAADSAGVPMVLNARTDVYWRGVGDPDDRFDEAVRRLRAYRDAGADCLFAPGVTDPGVIRALVQELRTPLNVLAQAGTPGVDELRELGVARLSVGSGPARAAVSCTSRLAEELLGEGTYTGFTDAMPYGELMELLRS